MEPQCRLVQLTPHSKPSGQQLVAIDGHTVLGMNGKKANFLLNTTVTTCPRVINVRESNQAPAQSNLNHKLQMFPRQPSNIAAIAEVC